MEFEQFMDNRVPEEVVKNYDQIIALIDAKYVQIILNRSFKKRYLEIEDLQSMLGEVRKHLEMQSELSKEVISKMETVFSKSLSILSGEAQGIYSKNIECFIGVVIILFGMGSVICGILKWYLLYENANRFFSYFKSDCLILSFAMPIVIMILGVMFIAFGYSLYSDITKNFRCSDMALQYLKNGLMCVLFTSNFQMSESLLNVGIKEG